MKTDKELAVELTIAFLQSWNAKSGTNVLKTDHVIDFYEAAYKAISESGQDQS